MSHLPPRLSELAVTTSAQGAQPVDHLAELPTLTALAARDQRWAPFRSYATLSLWRIADLQTASTTPVKRSQE